MKGQQLFILGVFGIVLGLGYSAFINLQISIPEFLTKPTPTSLPSISFVWEVSPHRKPAVEVVTKTLEVLPAWVKITFTQVEFRPDDMLPVVFHCRPGNSSNTLVAYSNGKSLGEYVEPLTFKVEGLEKISFVSCYSPHEYFVEGKNS